jgi:hypothetical protein
MAGPDLDRDDDDDAPERLERLLEHRARLDHERRARLGLIATVVISLGVGTVALASYWVGASDRTRALPAGQPPAAGTSARAPSGSGDETSAERAAPGLAEPARPAEPSPSESEPAPAATAETRARALDGSTAGAGAGGRRPAVSSAEAMAAYLVENVGDERAEARALQNAEWYVRGSSDHAYWLRVATAIRRARAAATR